MKTRRRPGDELAPGGRCRGAVEGDRPKIRKILQKVRDAVVLCSPDRLVEAARPTCRGNDVPEADPALRKPSKPPFIIERPQIFTDRYAKESPELVGRMRIIAPGSKRRITGKASKNEQPGIGRGDRRQSDFDAHQETPTASTRADE